METKKAQKKPREKAPSFTVDELDAHTTLLVRGGSMLYGLNHAESDEDYYRVVPDANYWQALGKWPTGDPKIKARQSIVGNRDETLVSESTFHIFCFEGVPQALESMFARDAIIDHIGELRESYYAGLNLDHMCGRYMRTIKAFAYGDRKKRRHSLRMSLNLREAMETEGRFNPTLTPAQVKYVAEVASSTPEEFTGELRSINYFTVEEDWNMDEIRERFATG